MSHFTFMMFTCLVLQTEYLDKEKHQHNTTSKINLVDLAGSERSSTANTTGDRLKVM